jgi:hypothetical protein
MFGTFGQLESAKSVVFRTSTVILAAAACDQLEKAGIPARMGKSNGSMVVVVPQNYTSESHQLLNGHSHNGEIYF